MRNVILSFFLLNDQREGEQGGVPDALFGFLFPVQQTTIGIDHHVK